MRQDFGIRNRMTGEIIKTFGDPIEAKNNLPDKFHEVVERKIENRYELLPDNKVYITGIRESWVEYKV